MTWKCMTLLFAEIVARVINCLAKEAFRQLHFDDLSLVVDTFYKSIDKRDLKFPA